MVIRIFDNKGETMDRYTVVIDESYYSMSENALSPDGFNQYGGQRIDLEDKSGYIRNDLEKTEVENVEKLPKQVKQAIAHRAFDLL
jgi:hypothetical protein